MTDFLNPTEQTIAAVVVAVFAGLIAVDLVWRIIRKLQRRQEILRAAARIEAYMAKTYPATMTEAQCDEMHAEHWNGD